jgi:hypothetical protein
MKHERLLEMEMQMRTSDIVSDVLLPGKVFERFISIFET